MIFRNLELLIQFDITRLRIVRITYIKWYIMQFMTHQADLGWYFLDIRSYSQQNLRPDSDPAYRTCSGKNSFDKNELQDLEKIKIMYLKLSKTSFVGSVAN